MVDRLDAMKVLRAVVDNGSFTKAAKALSMPLASVSRKVGDLETYLGTRLLARSTRSLSLTDTGLAYVETIRRLLDELEEAERTAAGEYLAPRGELIVTAPMLFGRLYVLPMVTDFLAMHPEIDMRLLLSDRNLHLIEDHVDLAVRIGQLPDSDLVATRVSEMETGVYAAPKLLGAHGSPDAPADLTKLPCVSFDIQAPTTSWAFRDPDSGRRTDVPIRRRLSVTTAEAAVCAAVAGIGVTRVLAYQAEAQVEAGLLREVLAGYRQAAVPIHVVHAQRDKMPLKARVFLSFAADRLRSMLARRSA